MAASRHAGAAGLTIPVICVDLGARQRVERVILHWETAYGKAYQIQTSNDSLNWTDIYSTTSSNGEATTWMCLAWVGMYACTLHSEIQAGLLAMGI